MKSTLFILFAMLDQPILPSLRLSERDRMVIDGELNEDGCKGVKDDVQELTKKFETAANDLASAKEAEVMGG